MTNQETFNHPERLQEGHIEEGSNLTPQDSGTGKNSLSRVFFATIIISVLLSSVFGAIFGFMAGGIGKNVLSEYINDPNLGKLSKIFGSGDGKMKNEIVKQKVIDEDSAVISVVENASPAVVSIVVSKDIPKIQGFFQDPFGFFDPFGSGPGDSGNGQDPGATQKQTIGGGTGFFITQDGMIATNKHVVSDPKADYTVITQDGKEYPAKVLALDPVNDIAVIKIEGSGFPILNFGDSSSLKIGQTVIAIGNSLGEFSNTVSRGIISGLKRKLTAGNGFGQSERLSDIIQTDAAINPGNSGGPLLDISGDVIGINVAMAQGAQNIGFAIPSDQIKKVIDQVKATGKISTPYFGVRYIPIDSALQKANNLPFNYGALVVRGQNMTDLAVVPGGPADLAGIVENDIILEIDGIRLDEKNGLADIISQKNVGDVLNVKVWHKGETKDVQVTLQNRNQ